MADVWLREGSRPLSAMAVGASRDEVDMWVLVFGSPGEVWAALAEGPFEELRPGRRYTALVVPTLFEAGRVRVGSCAVEAETVVDVREFPWEHVGESRPLEELLEEMEYDG